MPFYFLILLIIILDFITFRGLKRAFPKFYSSRRRTLRNSFIIQCSAAIAIVIGGFLIQRYIINYRIWTWYYFVFGILGMVYIPKFVCAMFLFADVFVSLIRSARHAVIKAGFCISPVIMCFILWAIVFGRFDFTVEPVEISFDNLPQSFDGYKIVQISDIHTGSFAGVENRFQKAVDMINEQNPGLIVFTGDAVNNFANELTPCISIFSQLKARDGKIAILGNHDYGGYYKWKSPADSLLNHKRIKSGVEQMGFMYLNNQSLEIMRDSDIIAIVGVENWGGKKKWFPKRTDLGKALADVRDVPFKILLSHNPSLWTEAVEGKTDISLTLAGHTHGSQVGIKLGKKRYNMSDIFRFRYLAGLYRTDKQYLYINRGLGVAGFPGRIGMPPEITVITLRKEK